MNEREVAELRALLSQRHPGAEVTVTAQPDGARIVVDIEGKSHKFSVGNGPSALLGQLPAGHPG